VFELSEVPVSRVKFVSYFFSSIPKPKKVKCVLQLGGGRCG
jgi:hypothetical protein